MLHRTVLAAGVVGVLMMASLAVAEDQGSWKTMMQQRHQMMTEVLQMTQETMGILKDLDHKPSDAQRLRLQEMMDRIGQIIEQHEQMTKQHMEMMKDRPHGGMMRKGEGGGGPQY